MNRKAVELPMNFIIIAAIALIVLVVLIYIFTGRTQTLVKGTEACSSKQGTCINIVEPCSGPIVSASNCAETEKCCVRVS